ncbi:peptidoglycan-binding protein [Kribbella antibiotica]|uniref:peptidoglycan-binding protein n=1 Tax=Kribbella antibiotica TaxID=190195 RepID=UPI00140546FD|nr:peptidoglycan-binding protein [Kribbella antibiotica]
MSSRRRAITAVVALAVVAGGGLAGFRYFDRPEKAVAANGPDPAQTVEITRTDLSQAREVTGQLGYGGSSTIKSHATGTITWLPKANTAMDRGDVLFRVDNKPVTLFYGSTPLFRAIGKAATPPPANPPASPPPSNPPANGKPLEGPDIRVVKENLTALGFLPKTTSDKLTTATTKAIKEWQKSLDQEATGVIDPTTVVVLPSAVRVDSIKAVLGDPAAADLLGVTATDQIVTLPFDADDAAGIKAGVKVKLALPNGKNSTGTIRSVSTDATPPPDGDSPADGNKKPQLIATISLDQQAASKGVDTGPVQVTVPGPARKDVLVVPVAALLALREGGYAVQVVNGTTTSLVGVQTGMFADGNVEITGNGLAEGQKVVTTS